MRACSIPRLSKAVLSSARQLAHSQGIHDHESAAQGLLSVIVAMPWVTVKLTWPSAAPAQGMGPVP